VFFFISAKFSFELLDFSLKQRVYSLFFVTLIFLIVSKPDPDASRCNRLHRRSKTIPVPTRFLARIALLLIKDQAPPFVLYAAPFFPLYQPKDLMPTSPS
jgi:hypothetical protein